MENPKKYFSYMLMTLMNLCIEAISYYQCSIAVYDSLDPKFIENKARSCISEALFTKLILVVSLIGYEDKHSFNIKELIKHAIKYKNNFAVDNKIVVKESNKFLEELKSIKNITNMVLKFRHRMFAHFNKIEIEKSSDSEVHPFYEIVNNIMKITGLNGSDDFFLAIEKIIELYSRILNYYNSISEEGFKLRFSADIKDRYVYKDTQSLLNLN